MLNLKKWMVKVSEKLSGLRGLAVVADDYYGANTSGQTHTYSIVDTSVYLLICGKINGTGSGFYLITVSNMNTMVGNIISSSVATVSANGLTLSIKVDANYMRVILIKVGGVKGYLLHLTESLKSFAGRRWAYAEPQEGADEGVRTGELSYGGGYGNLRDIDKREWYSVGDHPETVIRNAHWYSWILHRWNSWEQRNKRLCHENDRERGSACCQEQLVKRGIHQTASVLSCSGLTTIPGEGVMAC